MRFISLQFTLDKNYSGGVFDSYRATYPGTTA